VTTEGLPPKAPETPGTASGPEFDLLLPLRSTGTLGDPYPIYSLIRTVRPVLPVPLPGWEGPGVWLLTRYHDVHDVLRDPRFSVDRLKAPIVEHNLDRLPPFLRQSAQGLRSMLVMDPPDHTRLRKLVNKAFTPRRIAALRPHVEERVRTLVDEAEAKLAAEGRFDLIHDIAEPLPAVVIAELLGVPAEDHRRFREWSSSLIASAGNPDPARLEAATTASQNLFGYLSDTIAARRRSPREDLISAMLHAQEEGDVLSDLELLATSNLILLAGHETTTNLIGNGMLALMRERGEWERLRADASLAPRAVEELLRFDSPVQATVRVALEDVEIGEHVLPSGSLVIVNIGAANHDPEVFDAPERLDITRKPNPHLSFGFGTHFCMGAPLARMEGELVFEALAKRMPGLEMPVDDPRHRPNPILRGLERLELTSG
jgi:cytochrome P450